VLDPKTHQLQCEWIAVGGFLEKALRSWWIFISRDRFLFLCKKRSKTEQKKLLKTAGNIAKCESFGSSL